MSFVDPADLNMMTFSHCCTRAMTACCICMRRQSPHSAHDRRRSTGVRVTEYLATCGVGSGAVCVLVVIRRGIVILVGREISLVYMAAHGRRPPRPGKISYKFAVVSVESFKRHSSPHVSDRVSLPSVEIGVSFNKCPPPYRTIKPVAAGYPSVVRSGGKCSCAHCESATHTITMSSAKSCYYTIQKWEKTFRCVCGKFQFSTFHDDFVT